MPLVIGLAAVALTGCAGEKAKVGTETFSYAAACKNGAGVAIESETVGMSCPPFLEVNHYTCETTMPNKNTGTCTFEDEGTKITVAFECDSGEGLQMNDSNDAYKCLITK